MMKSSHLIVGALGAVMAAAFAGPLQAQHPVEGTDFMSANLRARGQPVLPIFDGWFPRPDGTYDLCFGFFNLNLEEVIEIPLGPDNFIEPSQYDGLQPSTFLPVPPPPNLYRRYFCTFSVNVPADIGNERVWWTLRQDGREYRVPGHITSENYMLEELHQPSRGSFAPVVTFISPPGDSGRGRSGFMSAPVTARVGTPIPLEVRVAPVPESIGVAVSEEGGSSSDGPRRVWWAKWAKHQGPGAVTFGKSEHDLFDAEGTIGTTATFSDPGRYVLRLQVIDTPSEGGSYQFHCCWTNAFVEVDVR